MNMKQRNQAFKALDAAESVLGYGSTNYTPESRIAAALLAQAYINLSLARAKIAADE